MGTAKKPLPERILNAETLGNRWLADGNAAREAGNAEKADKCYAKGQKWLDRANWLAGRSDRPAPKS
jgi:hypothetical protein